MSNEEFIIYLQDIFGGLLGNLITLLIVGILIAIELIAANMIGLRKMFMKAKKPSWAAFVPVYREWVICEMVGISPYWVTVCLCAIFLFPQIPVFGEIISFTVLVYYKVITSIALAKSFNYNNSYAVGIAFVPSIFYLIIGYNDSNYVGFKKREETIEKGIRGFLVKHRFIKK